MGFEAAVMASLMDKVRAAQKDRKPEDAMSLLVSARIVDPKTGGYNKRFFSDATVEASLEQNAQDAER